MAELKKRSLKLLDPFVSPALFRGGAGFRHPAVVDGDVITAEGTRFALADGQDPIPEGSEVLIWMLRTGAVCLTKADIAAHEAEMAAGRAKQAAEQARADQQRREEAEAFNAALDLPFRWTPGHRVVLGGLSERSWGNGMNRASVVHIMLSEDFASGRLKRKAGQFLCSSHVDAFGSDEDMRHSEGAKVTCKSCLARAATYGGKATHENSSSLVQAS